MVMVESVFVIFIALIIAYIIAISIDIIVKINLKKHESHESNEGDILHESYKDLEVVHLGLGVPLFTNERAGERKFIQRLEEGYFVWTAGPHGTELMRTLIVESGDAVLEGDTYEAVAHLDETFFSESISTSLKINRECWVLENIRWKNNEGTSSWYNSGKSNINNEENKNETYKWLKNEKIFSDLEKIILETYNA